MVREGAGGGEAWAPTVSDSRHRASIGHVLRDRSTVVAPVRAFLGALRGMGTMFGEVVRPAPSSARETQAGCGWLSVLRFRNELLRGVLGVHKQVPRPSGMGSTEAEVHPACTHVRQPVTPKHASPHVS